MGLIRFSCAFFDRWLTPQKLVPKPYSVKTLMGPATLKSRWSMSHNLVLGLLGLLGLTGLRHPSSSGPYARVRASRMRGDLRTAAGAFAPESANDGDMLSNGVSDSQKELHVPWF